MTLLFTFFTKRALKNRIYFTILTKNNLTLKFHYAILLMYGISTGISMPIFGGDYEIKRRFYTKENIR